MTRRTAAWTAGILAATALALAAMVAGWRVAGPTESDTELGRVSFEVSADKFGEVDAYVPIAETIRSFQEILDGQHDDLPESAFLLKGTIDDVVAAAKGDR